MLKKIFKWVKKNCGEKAQGMVEYALIISMVVAVCIIALTDNPISDAIHGIFNHAENNLNTAESNMTDSSGEEE